MKNALLHKRESYIVILTLVLWVVISFINKNFALPSYILDLVGFNSVYFICAMGILPLMIKGNFDLSVGGIIATVSLLLVAIVSKVSLPIVVLIPLGVIMGATFGLLNGYIIAKFKVSSVIVTLAMMNIHYGFSKYAYRFFLMNSLIRGDYRLENYGVIGISIENVMIVAVTLLTFYILRYRHLGRSAFAFGGNNQLAIRKGFNEFRTTLKLHSYSGMAAGLSAAIYLMTFNQASMDAYSGLEFELIIIVVIGGLNIIGGYGSVLGTFAAGMFIVMLKSGLVFARIPVFWHDMMIGLIIILVVSYEMYKYRSKLKRFSIVGERP